MSEINEKLLSPSISNNESVPLFSVRSGFYVAFFGGIYAFLIFNFINSKRLNRLKKDLPFYILWLIVGTSIILFFYQVLKGEAQLPGNLTFKGEWARYVNRVISLAAFASFYFLHKKYHLANNSFGIESLNPWKAGIISSVAGLLITLVLFRTF